MANSNFTRVGTLRATISEILEKVNGVNEDTGETYTYVRVKAYPPNSTEYVEENIFVDQFNKLEDIKVGNVIDLVTSQNNTTGKIGYKVFMASGKLTRARILELSGASADVVAQGKQQAVSAMDAVRARQQARAGVIK
jgi:hypothetical protein